MPQNPITNIQALAEIALGHNGTVVVKLLSPDEHQQVTITLHNPSRVSESETRSRLPLAVYLSSNPSATLESFLGALGRYTGQGWAVLEYHLTSDLASVGLVVPRRTAQALAKKTTL